MNSQESHILLSRFSHEVRNPAALISSFFQLLARDFPQITASPYYRQIKENMKLLNRLLDEMSRYNNASRIHPEAVDLRMFLRELVRSAGEVLALKGISLELASGPELPRVFIDRTRMLQVFYNLLRNAEEAMPEGGVIRISALPYREGIRITVRDSGPPIPREYLATLFDPLVTHKQDGTGLGLAICREILEAHGGSISASPEGDPVFTLWLPASGLPAVSPKEFRELQQDHQQHSGQESS